VIVVDTSVWIEADRRPVGQLPNVLRSLLDADEVALALPVRLELTAGVARKNRAVLLRALSALPVLRPTEETWDQIERWIPAAADKGDRFAMTDLMIAALAGEVGALVWSLDADFGRLETLGFVRRYESPDAPRLTTTRPRPPSRSSRASRPAPRSRSRRPGG
jgi:predicted nucleic acid-binding protein